MATTTNLSTPQEHWAPNYQSLTKDSTLRKKILSRWDGLFKFVNGSKDLILRSTAMEKQRPSTLTIRNFVTLWSTKTPSIRIKRVHATQKNGHVSSKPSKIRKLNSDNSSSQNLKWSDFKTGNKSISKKKAKILFLTLETFSVKMGISSCCWSSLQLQLVRRYKTTILGSTLDVKILKPSVLLEIKLWMRLAT